MTITGREPDGTLWISQDENCSHILLIPAGVDDEFQWDYLPSKRFPSEEEAFAWHEANCVILNRKR